MREFKVLWHEEVPKHLLWCCSGSRSCPQGDRSALVEHQDGKPVRVLGWDGGEPEDQTLRRDWAWVIKELNDMVQQQRRDACHYCGADYPMSKDGQHHLVPCTFGKETKQVPLTCEAERRK